MSKPAKYFEREVLRLPELAWIKSQGRASSKCQVMDISKTGAKIIASSSSTVPDRFELAFFQGQARSCEVIWRHGKVLGVRFAQ
jgi:hypothetical protein